MPSTSTEASPNLYRNGTHHDVRANDFDPEEARRIVSWVDHLLGLID